MAELGFGPYLILTLVSIAIDISLRVIMEKSCKHSIPFIFNRIFFILTGIEDNHKISNGFKIRQYLKKDCRVSCP